MDSLISFGQLAGILKIYGPFGLLVVIWYFDVRAMRSLIAKYRDDMTQVMSEHEKYMQEIRRMYESNVKLVEGYEDLAGDLKDLIVMNTQQLTHLSDNIQQNQFCPIQRVEKKKIEVEV